MKRRLVLEKHFGYTVWVNPTTEALREAECLCRNCGAIAQCSIANSLLKICINEHMAMAITRCFHWKPKQQQPRLNSFFNQPPWADFIFYDSSRIIFFLKLPRSFVLFSFADKSSFLSNFL